MTTKAQRLAATAQVPRRIRLEEGLLAQGIRITEQAQQADPDELALMVSMLYGATLRGFCRVIEKALGVHHA